MKVKRIIFCACALLLAASCGTRSTGNKSKAKILTVNFGCAASIPKASVSSVDLIAGSWGSSKIKVGEKCRVSPQNNAIVMSSNARGPKVRWTMKRAGGKVTVEVPWNCSKAVIKPSGNLTTTNVSCVPPKSGSATSTYYVTFSPK